jgi:hypothetical protein
MAKQASTPGKLLLRSLADGRFAGGFAPIDAIDQRAG